MINLDQRETPEKRYQAWVHNKVLVLSLTIHMNKPKDICCLLKHEFFLEEVEHHFMDSHAGYKVWRAFRYLKRYLKTYPHAKASRREMALAMLGFIYGRLGFDEKKIMPSCYGSSMNVAGKNNTREAALLSAA